ncbi:MAG: methyltransferase, FkbM family domain protein [Chitinophagaceae bacterium]|nr:methyltransferase, FkbM family domain protein [Chitinophagaceae bacterium]
MRSFILNITKGAIKKVNKLFHNPYKKIGFNWLQLRIIKNLPSFRLQSLPFKESKLNFYSREETLHSLREIFMEEIYKQQLPSSPYIIDCGANIGLSVLYMKMLYPDAVIIAFEPDELNFSILKMNVESYSLKNVEIKKEAVWTENTELNFSSTGGLMSKIEKEGHAASSKTKAIRLKDLLCRKIDFLKIDIEGAEYNVLTDIKGNLHFVGNLFIEYHGTFQQNKELNEILNIITENNFRYYIKSAIDKHPTPFLRTPSPDYDVQLNIFAFRG